WAGRKKGKSCPVRRRGTLSQLTPTPRPRRWTAARLPVRLLGGWVVVPIEPHSAPFSPIGPHHPPRRRLPVDLTTPHARALVSEAGPELLSRMRHDLAHLTPMPPSDRLDALLRDQEFRWGEGECVGAEVYLQAFPHMMAYDETLLYLISGELHLRGVLGDA